MEQQITYDEAVKIGIREGIKFIKEQEYYKTTKRYDRRLRNTRLLLKNYRSLTAHHHIADDSNNKIIDCNAIDVLDSIESIDDEEQYVQSISRTKLRTLITIQHIDRVLKYYEIICKAEGANKKRKSKIIYALFIDKTTDDRMPTYEELADNLGISDKTISRDIREAIEELSVLFFGIDGVKL